MDWIRRNWPDLLIGLALVAVIAGIVATLLTGGSFFPSGGNGGPGVTAPPATTAPAGVADGADGDPPAVSVLPGAGEGAADGGLAAPDAGPPGAPDPQVADDVAAGAGAAGESAAGEGAADEGAAGAADAAAPAGVQPLAPGDPSPGPAAGDGGASVDAAGEAPTIALSAPGGDDAAAAGASAAPTPAAASGAAAANDGLPTEPYRVAVGAFGNTDNAQRQAATFREAGYPVFVGSQGDLAIVLVGPYTQEAEAERVAAEIAAGDFGIDPVIYRFEEEGGASAGPADAPPGEEVAVDDAPEAEAVAAVTEAEVASSASAAGTLLQVGAYADAESAAPQIARLEGLGLDARPLTESGMVKLVIGPLGDAALADARTVLDGAGVDYFAR